MDDGEPIQKRGRKRGNQYCDEKKTAVSNKKAKKTKKETVEHTLNSTFSVDEDEDVNAKTINVDLPVVTSKPAKSRKLRGRKNDVYLTEESSANESESQKTPASLAKKSRRLNEKPPPNNATDKRIPVVRLKRLDTSGLNEDSSIVISSPEKTVVNEKKKQSVENQTPKKPSKPQSPVNEKITRKKLKKSKSAVSIENSPDNEPEMKKMPVRRTRSFGQTEIPAVENQTFADQQQKEVLTKKLKESGSNAASPKKEPSLQSPVAVGKKMPLRRTSTHPLRSRKPTVNSPAKRTTMTPMTNPKKAVQFTAKSNATNIPKAIKPKAAPNFADIHQKNFLKMQSVDEYVERKRTRTETMNSSRSVLHKTPQAKPAVTIKAKAVTPDSMTTRNMKFNFVSGVKVI